AHYPTILDVIGRSANVLRRITALLALATRGQCEPLLSLGLFDNPGRRQQIEAKPPENAVPRKYAEEIVGHAAELAASLRDGSCGPWCALASVAPEFRERAIEEIARTRSSDRRQMYISTIFRFLCPGDLRALIDREIADIEKSQDQDD